MDTSQYLGIFLDETKEHLENLNTQIMNLEQDPENMDTINDIFRAAHSMKGMAGTMGYKRMQNLTHDMENVFTEVRSGNIKVNSPMIDILFQCLDALEEYLELIQNTQDEGTNDNENLIKALNQILSEDAESAEEASKEPEENSSEAKTEGIQAKWQTIELKDKEKEAADEATEAGNKLYGLTVQIQEGCILKAARAFLVFKAVEDYGEIIVSNPNAQDIEDEKFGLDFSLIVATKSKLEVLLNAAKGVSEIEDVLGDEYCVKIPETPKEENTEGTKPAVTQTVPALSQQKSPVAKKAASEKPVVNRTVRVDIEKLDVLMNLVSELIIAKNSLVSASSADANASSFNEQIEYLESVTTNLHESVMKVRMVPIESCVSKFPRMIRDLSKKLDKQMELTMTGEETELDRTVVDEIGDPLMHLLRNSADHGLESAELRAQRGKPAVGKIFLNAYQDGNNVIIEVGDDGNGIDTEAVKKKAIDRGVITPEQGDNMSEKEIIGLLFNAGFSTAKQITDVSGRGVGLDVVKSKIESLSGEVEVKSKLGEGSTWTIRLPLTLAIIQALMVEVGEEKYAISLSSIQTIESITREDIKLVQAKEVIHLRGTVIPIIRMNKVLETESKVGPDEDMTVVIVKKGDKQAGLVVDGLIGQQEIVIKSLGKYISKTKFISGATILGDGEVALIIDPNPLIG